MITGKVVKRGIKGPTMTNCSNEFANTSVRGHSVVGAVVTVHTNEYEKLIAQIPKQYELENEVEKRKFIQQDFDKLKTLFNAISNDLDELSDYQIALIR